MKTRQIALAAAACCATFASLPSLAITASNYTNSGEITGDTLNIRISGASAQDAGILGSALSLCVAGTVHRYAISNNFVFYCTPDIGTGPGQITVPAGKTKLAIYKYSVGGSYFGVGPVNSNTAATGSTLTATGNQLPFLDLALINANLTGAVTTTVSYNAALGSYVNVALSAASSAVTSAATTYIGLSDVEPGFFTNTTSNLTANSVYALIFGVPVSLNLRNALQAQQGLVSNSETEANMPSLSSAQISSAFTQQFQTWAGIGVTTGFLDDAIYVARRVNSSGTQKTFEALFARTVNSQSGLKNCVVVDNSQSPGTFLAGTNNVDNTTGDNANLCSGATTAVFSGSGGGDVRTCLINHNNGSRGAIGMLTTEDKPGTANWRFVKVDGVTPNQAQTAAGRYRGYVESYLNTRTSGAFATGAAPGYPAFVTRLSTDLANPTIIKAINGTDQSFGSAGLMALYSRQVPAPTLDFTGATSVLPLTKADALGVNNCQAPLVSF